MYCIPLEYTRIRGRLHSNGFNYHDIFYAMIESANAIFGFLTAVLLKVHILWDETLCNCVFPDVSKIRIVFTFREKLDPSGDVNPSFERSNIGIFRVKDREITHSKTASKNNCIFTDPVSLFYSVSSQVIIY